MPARSIGPRIIRIGISAGAVARHLRLQSCLLCTPYIRLCGWHRSGSGSGSGWRVRPPLASNSQVTNVVSRFRRPNRVSRVILACGFWSSKTNHSAARVGLVVDLASRLSLIIRRHCQTPHRLILRPSQQDVAVEAKSLTAFQTFLSNSPMHTCRPDSLAQVSRAVSFVSFVSVLYISQCATLSATSSEFA